MYMWHRHSHIKYKNHKTPSPDISGTSIKVIVLSSRDFQAGHVMVVAQKGIRNKK